MRLRIWAAVGLGALIGMWSAGAATAAEFTDAQRQAIETIVRDYLMKNPEVMIDVLQAAQEKLKGESRDKAAAALTSRKKEIFEDADAPVAGNPKGDVTLVEFFDYRCPYCKQVQASVETLLAEDKRLRF